MEKNNGYKKITEDSLQFYQEFLGEFSEGKRTNYHIGKNIKLILKKR